MGDKEESMADVFECPSCSAPLKPDGAATTVTCPFCGDTVVVPPGLRTPALNAPGPAPTVVVQIPSTYTPSRMTYSPRPARGNAGCISLFVVFMILLTVGLPLYLSRDELFPQLDTQPTIPDILPKFRASATPTPAFGDPVLTIDGKAAGPAAFTNAQTIALDPAGNIYLTDSKPGRILKFDAQGKFVSAWQVSNDYPDNLVADSAGTLYSVVNSAIRKYDSATGQLQDTLTWKDENFGFFGLGKLAVLPGGNLLATIQHSDNLVQLDPHGQEIRRYSHPLKGHTKDSENSLLPAVDAQGNIYLLGTDTERVYKLGADGKFAGALGTKGDGPGELENTRSLAIDPAGRFYVSDSDGIQVFDPTWRYLGLIKTPGFVYDMVAVGDGQVFATTSDQAIKYRLNPNAIPTPPIIVGPPPTPTAPDPTNTPLPSVGSTVTYDGWVISLGGAQSRPTIKLNSRNVTLQPDGRFIMIWVDARNQQVSAHNLGTDFQWALRDENDRSYYPEPMDDMEVLRQVLQQESRDSINQDVAPHVLAHPLLLFDVPVGAPGLQLAINSTVGSGEIDFDLAIP
jgi:sugar lactone lactonase YvrE